MSDDPKTESLREWNRLTRENTENSIVSSMFEATSKANEPIETFVTWLLVGTAAIASFLITNADKLVPLIKPNGFLACGAFLCVSCLFGLISKIYALRCKVAGDIGSAVRQAVATHLEKHKEEKERIKEGAEFWEITLETDIRLERVINEFFTPYASTKMECLARLKAIKEVQKQSTNWLHTPHQTSSYSKHVGFITSAFIHGIPDFWIYLCGSNLDK